MNSNISDDEDDDDEDDDDYARRAELFDTILDNIIPTAFFLVERDMVHVT